MRIFFRIIALLIVLAVVGGIVGYVWLSTSLPATEGSLQLKGLSAPVTVARDDLGVPRITAQTGDDALFALGFVHAQDRLWQMEFQRRLGAGRLSELLGSKTIPYDRFMRTLGLYHLAEESYEHLSPETKRAYEAYSAGVNAYISAHHGALPPEFVVLRATPEPWKPTDSLVWGRLMGLQLSSNWRDELLHARVAAKLPADQVNDLWAAYPKDQPITMSANDTGAEIRHAMNGAQAPVDLSMAMLDKLLAAIPAPAMPRLASNQWVVGGSHTATGEPLLANDPHLELEAPVLWYLASIVSPDLEVTGVTVPGVPAVILGHNKRIAWGLTTTTSDTMDTFIEHVQGDGYQTPDGVKPFDVRDEVIKVNGSAPVTIKVRSTRHGPVVSDVLGDEAGGQILSLSASFLQPDDISAQSILEVDRAQNWDQFLTALHDFGAPQQNFSYADVDGHIGMIAPGRVPVRKSGDGSVPHAGWSGEFDWTGWIPFDELPKIYDPPSGLIVNANNRLVGDDYPHFLAVTWPEGYRAQRITDLLKDRSGLTARDMVAMQMDEKSLATVELKPLLLHTPPVGPQAIAAHTLLEHWDGTADQGKPQPLIYNSWTEHLQRDLLRPWLGTEAGSFSVKATFLKTVLNGRTVWCAPPGKAAPANCDAVVAQALEETVSDLTAKYGPNLDQWRWGDAHPAELDALLFGRVPFLDKLTKISGATGGDDYTVQRGSYVSPDQVTFVHRHGAGFRGVYDLSALDTSRFMIATGQSGNPISEHWSDLFERWRAGASFTLDADRPRPHVLTLVPAP